jgi:glycine oxidase
VSALVHRFAVSARDRYVGFLEQLGERSRVTVALNRLGILETASDENRAVTLQARRVGTWLDSSAVAELEPGLRPPVGALYFEADGSVDNIALLRALRAAIEYESRLTQIDALASHLGFERDHVTCTTTRGDAYSAPIAVLAAGAWSANIAGLPRSLPIEPMRGQMFSIAAGGEHRLRHVVYGPDAYIVPRGDRILVGATVERVGFDSTTTASALEELRTAGASLWPPIETTPSAASWAGLRPMTPDLIPIIGRDPEHESLIYATGHSRSGILMGPLTGDCVAALASGEEPPMDLSPFRVERFSRAH